jgi:hypothetical protein
VIRRATGRITPQRGAVADDLVASRVAADPIGALPAHVPAREVVADDEVAVETTLDVGPSGRTAVCDGAVVVADDQIIPVPAVDLVVTRTPADLLGIAAALDLVFAFDRR